MSVEVKVLIEVALTSLAGAAIFYITFLIAVDEVRKDMAGGDNGNPRRNRNTRHLRHGCD